MEKSDDGLDSPDPEVAACQIQVEDLDVETNLQRIREYALQLPDSTDIAIFPEYSLTGYTDDERVYGVAMTRDEVVPKIRGISEETDTEILFGFIEEREDGEEYYNSAGYVTPEKDTVYRKRNLWSSEEELLSQGEERVVIKTSAGKIGILTCYDLNFVDESAAFTREKVDALFVIGAWDIEHVDNWRLLLRARAFDGVRWVVGCGRTGKGMDNECRYAGASSIVSPDGTISSSLDTDEGILIDELSHEKLRQERDLVGIFSNSS